ncbi:hypothetical protein ACIA2T_24770 [Amycolatopsis japonica]|uniref:lipase/acyltransferase domain-containing protein n=1 Tax=Amycolatopsis japonica TaxID=208439 RepID=UPI0037BA53EC
MRVDARQDAVVIVPGIMGSELIEADSGKVLWGLRRAGWYVDAWATGGSLQKLELTAGEREGRVGRIRATKLLQFPAFAPFMAGFEPYTNLTKRIRQVVADPAAILEFPYDWRLPVEYNAGLLALAAERHLDSWRRHPAHDEARRRQGDDRPGRLVLIAHSMGGLLCRGVSSIPGAADQVRAVVTLGTPFDGAAKAALILNSGRGAPVPLPRQRMQRLAATLPGLHDLLPQYRCVDAGDDVVRLSSADVSRIGGDGELAAASAAWHSRMAKVELPGHRALVGVDQPTVQGILLRDGVAHPSHDSFRVQPDGELARDSGTLVRIPGTGDGTVPRNSAMPIGFGPSYIAQHHGSLARIEEALTLAGSIALEQDSFAGPRLGDDEGGAGLDAPDLVDVGAEWSVEVMGVEPGGARCTVTQLETLRADQVRLLYRDEAATGRITVTEPGLYRVTLSAGSTSPITQLVMAI